MTFQLRTADPRKREGALLWPQRMGERAVRAFEEMLGEYGTAGQLQQRPAPRGGGIVKREHFRFYRKHETPTGFDFIVISVDAAFKGGDTSSYVVLQVWGRSPPNSYLLEQVRDRMTFTRTLKEIRALRVRHPRTNVVLIEDKANGSAIIDVLRREIPGVLAEEPGGSKASRAEAAAPIIQAGNVWIPDPAEQPWVEAFISEWCAVPNAAFWDQVDSSDQYLNKYGRAMRASIGDSMIVGSGASDGVASAADSPWASGGSGTGSSEGSPWG